MTKASELRQHDRQELAQRLAESQKELFNLRFQHATGRLDNVARLSFVRREIARLHTLLGEPEQSRAALAPTPAPRRRRAKKTTEDE